MIETINLVKNFGELQVLRGINEKVEKGEVISIIGPSGSGKSTFLRCLNLMEQPTSGQVLFHRGQIVQVQGIGRHAGICLSP